MLKLLMIFNVLKKDDNDLDLTIFKFQLETLVNEKKLKMKTFGGERSYIVNKSVNSDQTVEEKEETIEDYYYYYQFI